MRGSRLTFVLIGLNVAVFAAMLFVEGAGGIKEFSGASLCLFGADYLPLVRQGQYYRLITSTFIHMNILHLVFNMSALAAVGRHVEVRWGGWRYFLLYVVSGLLASGASLVLHRKDPVISAGASGAICGLIGAVAVMAHRMGQEQHGLRNVMLRWGGMTLAYGFFLHADNAAHAGGLVAGAALGFSFPVPGKNDPPHRGGILPALAMVALFGTMFGLAYRSRDRALPGFEYVSRGNARSEAGDVDGAIELYRRAIEIEPDESAAHYDLGLVLARKGQLEEAERAFTRARELDPDPDHAAALADVLVDRGVEAAHANDLDLAISFYSRALVLAPRHALALFNLAIALEKKGDLNEAEKTYRKALAIDPKSDARGRLMHILDNRGYDNAKAGRFDESIAAYKGLLELAPDDELAHFNLSISLDDKGDYEAALASIDRALALRASRRGHMLRARVLLHTGRKKEATEEVAKGRALPDDDEAGAAPSPGAADTGAAAPPGD